MTESGFGTSIKQSRAEEAERKAAMKKRIKRISGVIGSSISDAREELVKKLWGSVYATQPPLDSRTIPMADFDSFCRRLQEKLEEELAEKLSQ